MVFSKAAIELLRLKYCRDNETPEEPQRKCSRELQRYWDQMMTW
jgi:hypothetical protein